MANIDTYVTKGQTDVQDELQRATDDVQRMGEDFQETKEGLSGMPGGLDSDIATMIEAARDQGKAEAEADIEGVKSSVVADAKASADAIKTDVTQKINDNATAKSKMEGISSKYGKSAMDRAATALDQNTDKGNDLMQMLDDAMRDADQAIEGVKGNL
jgi:gas vesicle protein